MAAVPQLNPITPSPDARKIYSMMVMRSEQRGDDTLLPLAQTIELSCVLSRQQCDDDRVGSAVAELQAEQWIEPDCHSGGWLLT